MSHDDRSKLSFRARAILDDLRRAAHAGRHQLSGRGGVVVLHETLATLEEADRASLHRRVAVLPPREQRRLVAALATLCEQDDIIGRPRQHSQLEATDDPTEAVWVTAITPPEREQAARTLVAGNLKAFLAAELDKPGVHDRFTLVLRNAGLLHSRGLLERALVGAFRQGWAYEAWPAATLAWLFSVCDPHRLRAAGDPLPGSGPWEVFRGGGRGAGLSWSRDPLVAAYFADLGGTPEIRKTMLGPEQVRCYFASFAAGVWFTQGNGSPFLPWLNPRSDEFIAAADPGGEQLEAAEVLDLTLRTRL